MPFIASFSVDANKTHPFPFNIPAVAFAKNIEIDERVTIFVGDNGSGKSTLLEAIAVAVDLPLIGGHIGHNLGFEAERLLKPYFNIEWRRSTRQGFFFRAEDFSDFINSVENSRRNISDHLSDLKGEVDDSIISKLNDSMNYSLFNMRKQYGENMQAFSHGEAYLKILETRIGNKGVFLLDEPEAALSPIKQLSLM